jgi:hypothetical protein
MRPYYAGLGKYIEIQHIGLIKQATAIDSSQFTVSQPFNFHLAKVGKCEAR